MQVVQGVAERGTDEAGGSADRAFADELDEPARLRVVAVHERLRQQAAGTLGGGERSLDIGRVARHRTASRRARACPASTAGSTTRSGGCWAARCTPPRRRGRLSSSSYDPCLLMPARGVPSARPARGSRRRGARPSRDSWAPGITCRLCWRSRGSRSGLSPRLFRHWPQTWSRCRALQTRPSASGSSRVVTAARSESEPAFESARATAASTPRPGPGDERDLPSRSITVLRSTLLPNTAGAAGVSLLGFRCGLAPPLPSAGARLTEQEDRGRHHDRPAPVL